MNSQPLRNVSQRLSAASRAAQLGQSHQIDTRMMAEQIDGCIAELVWSPRWRASILAGVAAKASRLHAMCERLNDGDNAYTPAELAAELASLRHTVLHLLPVDAVDDDDEDSEAA